jgi:hypothetical protein
VAKRKVDHTDKNYNPDDSVNAVDMRAGRRLSFVIQHIDNQGKRASVTQVPAATSHEFAVELADRVNEVVPAGFAVTADEVSVVLSQDGARIGSTDMAELVESSENLDHLPDNLRTAAWAILSNVQDGIADTTATPWPGERSQPNPRVEIVGDQLRMWFGEAESPTLELRALTVPVIQETD